MMNFLLAFLNTVRDLSFGTKHLDFVPVFASNVNIKERFTETLANPKSFFNFLKGNDDKYVEDLAGLKNEQRKKNLDRIKRLSRAAELGSRVTGHQELAEFFEEGAELAGAGGERLEGQKGALRNVGANLGGKGAQALAKKPRNIKLPDGKQVTTPALTGGQAAALGGAVAGALQGEGVGGIAKSAWSWYVLYIAFGFLVAGITLSPTIAAMIPAVIALIYLDFHYIMSKFGSKIFGPMTLWQKMVLLFANLLVALFPMIFMVFIYTATCGNSIVSSGASLANKLSLGYVENYCVAFNQAFQGGRTGGGGGGASFGYSDAEARALLLGAGITVNATQPQTSLEGIQVGTVNELIRFSQACSRATNPNSGENTNACRVIFTGGTETTGGHAGGPCSHLSGHKFDIDDNAEVNNYIINSGNFTFVGNRGTEPQYRNNATQVIYTRESNHWDVGGVGCT